MTRIVCISDTHHRHKKVQVPDGDVLIHAGDITGRGTLQDIEDFARWIKKLPHATKLVIAGNHDWPLYNDSKAARNALGDSCTYLEDSGVVANNLKFYGMPWSPRFGNWAFYYERGSKEILDKCNQIPFDTDVLITHGPPYGILDLTFQQIYAGCQTIRNRIYSLQNLKLHVFGHIHEGYSQEIHDGIRYVNASICTLGYQPTNKPIVVEI